ncbi:MAG: hypothetical protein IJW44_04445 [Clostridia bacterium]|nr:hypothetical protein [Clostridia bacterium]
MLEKFVRIKWILACIGGGVLFALWLLLWIFGNREDKILVLVLTPILPFVIYGFMRLMFLVVGLNASVRVMRFFCYFFLIGGLLGIGMMVVEYVRGFPNGLSPTLGGCLGMIVAVLDEARKRGKSPKENG